MSIFKILFIALIVLLIWKREIVVIIYKSLFTSIYLNQKSTLNESQYRKILLAAIYSEQQMAFINSLETGLEKSKLETVLGSWWGILSTEDAHEALQYLQNKGFRYYFPTVFKAFVARNLNSEKLITDSYNSEDESYSEDVQKTYSQLSNLHETWEELVEEEVLSSPQELEKYNVVGWDCGRLVFLSRLCLEAGYISETEAWAYIDAAYALAIQHFDNWKDYSKSYVIGRAMWGGGNSENGGIIHIANNLLENKKSPWLSIKLK